ncbi:MAG: NAD(P)/FAD-dependent oxidoreductase [Simkaniaceae bacterium]|nr:NAD(P)/FAD-dependent oxidoreductase [Simkaniaceae bacterium]
MKPNKVIVIGGGFAGLNVVRSLRKADFDVLLIDQTNHHLFQPLLYQVASATLSPADVATPFRDLLRRQKNVSVLMARAEKIEKERKRVVLDGGEIREYDYLVVATGARHSYFGRDEWERSAPGLKTVKDAIDIRERILFSFEQAERAGSPDKARRFLRFVIIGAGPTGVEMAGAIAEIAYKGPFRNFRRIAPSEAKIYLLEATARVLPPFPEKLSVKARTSLEKMGVSVMTGLPVTDVTEEGVRVGGEMFIETCNVIWAAGNQAGPLLKTLGVPLDRQGRVIVGEDLTVSGHPELFVIGDACCVKGKEDKPLPAVAPVAIQEGRYVADMLKSVRNPEGMRSKTRPRFKYFDKGSIATIGKNRAVGYMGGFLISGFFAWLIWGVVHVLYLVSYRSRLTVMLHWMLHYCTGLRGAGLIRRLAGEGDRPKGGA